MAWSSEDVDRLKKQMAQGASMVKTGDKEIQFIPFKDQQKLLSIIETEAGTKPQRRKKLVQYSKGL